MKRKKKWIHTFLPVLAGFLALYLVLMGIATFLIKETFMERFETDFNAVIHETEETILGAERDNAWLANGNMKAAIQRYDYVLCSMTTTNNVHFQCSFALFNEEKALLSQSQNLVGLVYPDTNLAQSYSPIENYLSQEALKELAYYGKQQLTSLQAKWNISPKRGGSPPEYNSIDYRITMAFERGSDVPVQIIVQEMNWNKEQKEKNSSEVSADSQTHPEQDELILFSNDIWDHSMIVWSWTNPDIDISGIPQNYFFELECYPNYLFPYLSSGYDRWLSWQENSFLQNLKLDKDLFYTLPQYYASADSLPPFQPQTKKVSEIFIPQDDRLAGRYYLVAAVDCHPWLAAMDYMRYFYLLGFACMLVCAGVLAFAIHRTNLRRDALEENRRDFTNAIAHELKTPLCAIRGYAENLKEDTVQVKRDHYLDQIILKTEEMDGLAAEMIYVSRLDSEKLVLKKEPVCLNDLIQTQLEKLDDVISGKKLLVLYQAEEEFHVTGDRKYLEKAIWNLLSNAISYNTESGTIRIIVGKDRCSMENTGEHIPEADLPHVFEMFYSGQRHFGDEEKHLGVGLYLTRKICALHRLSLTVQNTEMGVRAEISL